VFLQWGVLGIAATTLFVPAWLVLRPLARRPTPMSRSQDTDGRLVPTRPALTRLIISYGLFGFGYVVTATFIVAMARELDGEGYLEPLTWIIVGLLAMPSVLVWQWVADRMGMIPALRLAFAIEAVGVLLAGFGQGAAMLIAGGALLGGTVMGITALGLVAARQMSAESSGGVIGLMTGGFGLGQLIGPAVAGRLAEASGGFGMPSLVAALLLVAGVVLLQSETESPGSAAPK